MPRPCKRRRVCFMPENKGLLPFDKGHPDELIMTVDEYEAIRLIDLENMSQEDCASVMGVSRTTAQSIYNSARIKLAECLVKGRELKISGGDYTVCEGKNNECSICHRKQCHKAKDE